MGARQGISYFPNFPTQQLLQTLAGGIQSSYWQHQQSKHLPELEKFHNWRLSTVCLYIKHKLKTNKQQPTILKLLNLHGSLISFTLSLVHASYPKHGNLFKLQLKQGNSTGAQQ